MAEKSTKPRTDRPVEEIVIKGLGEQLLLGNLSERQKFVLLERANGRSLSYIANELGITCESVRQLQVRGTIRIIRKAKKEGENCRGYADGRTTFDVVGEIGAMFGNKKGRKKRIDTN